VNIQVAIRHTMEVDDLIDEFKKYRSQRNTRPLADIADDVKVESNKKLSIKWTGFVWYDFWIGAYWDIKNRRLYLMVPFTGIMIDVP